MLHSFVLTAACNKAENSRLHIKPYIYRQSVRFSTFDSANSYLVYSITGYDCKNFKMFMSLQCRVVINGLHCSRSQISVAKIRNIHKIYVHQTGQNPMRVRRISNLIIIRSNCSDNVKALKRIDNRQDMLLYRKSLRWSHPRSSDSNSL